MEIRGADSERTVTLVGHPKELEALATELQSWEPTGGWSEDAQELFDALRGEQS